MTWTCQSGTTWQMQQPIADYQAGKRPTWADCEAWRNGNPGPNYVWSYGASVATTTSTTSSTTTSSTTTLPETTTTTTVQETTTTTTVEETATTTLPPTTTTSSTTTTTQAPPPPPPPPPPAPTTTEQETTTTTSSVPETTVPVETTTTTQSPPPQTTTTTQPLPTTTTVETSAPAQVTDTSIVVSTPVTTSDQDTEQAVATILANEPTQEQAVALATNPQVLATVTQEQAEAIFKALDVASLDESEVVELIAAVQNAPTEVREAFEATVDIFKNSLDTYIPTGSNIPVGERRALIAIGAAITAAGATTRIRR